MLEWSEDTMQPFIADAEDRYIIPAIGQAMFNDLMVEYAFPTTNTPISELLLKIQKAIGRYALFEGAPQMIAAVGDYGIHEHTTANSSAASPWRYYEMKESLAEKADAALDEALRFMESEVPGTFVSWETAPQYLLSKELFINNSEAFSKHVPIKNSRRAWLILREFLKEAEIIYALPNLGLGFFNDLKGKILSNSLSAFERQFLSYLGRSMANYTVYKALPKIPIVIRGDGVRISSYQDYYQMKLAAKNDDLTALKSDSLESGVLWMNVALNYLRTTASATVFPIWFLAQQAATAAATNPSCCVSGKLDDNDSGVFMF